MSYEGGYWNVVSGICCDVPSMESLRCETMCCNLEDLGKANLATERDGKK